MLTRMVITNHSYLGWSLRITRCYLGGLARHSMLLIVRQYFSCKVSSFVFR